MSLAARLKAAVEADPSIVRVPIENGGYLQEHMLKLGLTKADLKKLEAKGIAYRAYTKNIWVPGEKMPNGIEIKPEHLGKGAGHRVLWTIIGREGGV